MLRIGLTGGIASGKTTVADMFAELGAQLIDTDLIAREVVAPGSDGLAAVVAAFGPDVLTAEGTLDRARMRQIVFADESRRRELESILHPRIQAETASRMASAGGDYKIIVVPLLVQSPLKNVVDRVLVVDCPEALQLERLLQRDAESEEQARSIIESQSSREERLAVADDVVVNDGDLASTRAQVEVLHQKYLALAAGKSHTG